MFTHLSTRIISSVYFAARRITQTAAQEAAVLTVIALISIVSATILVAQDLSATTDLRTRAIRSVAPIDGSDPNEGQRVDEPGLLDKAYDLVFGPKSVPTSNLMVTVNSCAVDSCTPSAIDNDFRRINDAIISSGSGNTIILNGVFDWTEPFAAADWANGSDYVPSGDDYSILAPAGLINVTITANSLGSATIQGPGDLASVNLEGVFQFYSGGVNSGWTISNIEFKDFDNPIGFYQPAPANAFSNTTITGNAFYMGADLNATAAPVDVNQNIAIHYSYGANQTISNNTFYIAGTGLSNTPVSGAATVVMQSNTSGGSVYEGLQVTNNTAIVTGAQSADPESIIGFWENSHAHLSNITVSGNKFSNAVYNDPALSRQTAFRATSHSGASTAVNYTSNSAVGSGIGIQFYSTGATVNPVNLNGNTFANGRVGALLGNSGSAANVNVNFLNNRIAGNSVAAIDNATNPGGTAVANSNWWGCNNGPGATALGCPVAANGNTGTVTAGTPLTLAVSALPTNVVSGGASTITSTLTNVPDGTPVTFGGTFGTSVGNGPTLIGGTQTAVFTAVANDAGAGTGTTTVDGQTMSASITVHPKVNSINRKNPLPQQTNLTTVVFEVAFSAPVSNVDDTDFVVTQLLGPATGSVTGVSCPSPFDKCDVTVLATGGSGQLRLDLVDDNSITRRLAPSIQLGGTAIGDGSFSSGQDYIIDVSGPSVTAITKLDADPTAATSLQFSVSFSEPVSGVDTTDFVVTGTGSGTVSSVTGTGPYTVTVTGVTAPLLSGTVGINVDDDNSIIDTSLPTGNPLGGPTLTDGDYTGPLYTVDQTAPTGTLAQSVGQADPTAGMTVSFTVVFTDALAISGFDAADVTVQTGVGTAFGTNTPIVNISAPTISAPTTTYTVSVSNMDQPGQVTASIATGSVTDAVGNAAADVVEGDNTVYYTFGLTSLVVDLDGFASDTDCNALTPTAYTTIQSAINAAVAGNTIKVCPATYPEDVTVNKALTIVGVAGAATTIIEGPIGGSGSTVFIGAGNVDFSGFTVTRAGNNATDWTNINLNSIGLSMNAGTGTGNVIHDNIFVGNRNGLDINNTGTTVQTIRNNVIDNNRTGVILRNQTDNVTFIENSVSDNHTLGILFLDASVGTNSPIQQARNAAFINNKISGNWFGQIVDRQSGGALPAPGTTNLKNFQGNWYGTTTPVVTTANSAEGGYSLATCPAFYSGCTGPVAGPGGQPDIAGPASANLRFNLPLTSGADTNVETTPGRGTFGFQGAPIVVDGPEVNPIDGWGYITETPTGTGEFESGPIGAPLGTGSSRISITSGGGQAFGTLNYGGIRMDRITSLKYSSYQVGQASVAPYLAFDFDNDLDDVNNAFQGRLVFEPEIDNPGSVLQSTWQNWDARAGKWWATGGLLAGTCTMATPCTWNSIVTTYPNAGVRRVANFGALLFKLGSGPVNTTGYVDNFEIGISTGETVYDFESDGTPDPTVVSSVRATPPNPSSAASVDFTVTFSEPVIGVDPADFTLATTGTIAGASVTGATTVGPAPSAVWTVTVNTGSGSGDIRLDTVSGGITDVAGNPLSTGFTTGEAYTMDRDLVTVTVEQAGGQGDPTNTLPINFTVQFSEAVTGFDNPATDLTLGGVATAATITPVDGDTYTVAVTAASGFGFVTVSVPASVADDNLGNDNAASTSADNSVNYTFGSSVIMVDDDGLAVDGNCGALVPNSAYTTIQAAVAASGTGNTIKVCPGTYTTPPTVAVNVTNLTITAAEATKPLVQASGTADAFDVTATGVTIQNLEIQKLGTGDQHHMIRVQANGFQGLGNYIHGPSWQTPNHVSRAFILNAGLTGWLIDGNTIENLRQPAYFTTGSGTVSNNIATGTKGWVNDGGLITFTNNTFGQTCLPCDTDIALLAATTSPAYEAFYSAANNLVISTGNNNAHIDVQFTPAADSGRAVTYVDDTAAPGGDGRVGTPHQSIQTAIFKAGPNLVDGTLPGGTVNVAAGTYAEQLTVNRQLNILGPNAAIDPNTGSRVAEAVIIAAVNDTDPFDGADDENSIMVTITNTADGTVFKGFTLDGDNPLLDSNYVLNGADVDAYGGISGNGNINPAADISFNIVKNLGEFGIEVYGDPNAAGVRTNSRIANNKVDNVVGWFYGNAIFAGNNASTNVEDNVVTQSFGGIMIHHFNGQVTSRPNSVVDGNTITAFGYPIWFNLHYAYSGNGYTVSNNTIDSYVEQDAITLAPRASNSKFEGDKEVGLKRPRRISENEPQNSVGGWGRWIGIKVESVNGLVPATFTDNNIDGNRALLLSDAPPYTQIDGFRITNPSTTSSNIVIKENNITDTNRGIAHTADALVDINCNNIYGNQIGIYIGSGFDYDGNPESADIGATIFNNNILGNAVFGVQAQTGTSAVNNASGNYWGAADGPGPVGPGTGDNVSNDVNFAGFLTIPSTCSPVAPPPTVTIEQVGPDPTNTSPINFTVTFSEAVTDFDDSSDIALSGTAGATTVVITGGPTAYNVAVSGMANDGTVIADVVAGAATGANGANVASTSLDNTVTYDTTSPTVGVEQKLGQNDPTNASPIEFTVTFSEPTANFVTGDVNLSASTAPGTLVGTVTGGPTVFNVAVTGMTGSGTVVASVDAGAATDAANNGNAASTSTDNSVYYDVTNPTVTIDQQTVPAQADPTSTSPVNFSIVISDASAISGFDASDVTIATGAGTAFGGFAVPNVVLTGGPTTFNAAVSGMNQTGLVTATIAGGTFVDGAGNPNAASTSADNNVQFNLVNTNITVTPSDMLGWSFVQENAGVASGRMMTGPATPPLGTGSARITVDATAGQAFMKDAYSGVRFADITALSYSAYQHSGANPSIHATLAFDVDSDVTDGINGYQGRIVYEPYNDPANTFTPLTWQTFDAMSPTAKFWGSGTGPARPFSNACPQSAPCTKAQILTLFPNLGIRNNVPMTSIGRVIFKVGSLAAPGLDASVDNLVIGVNSVNDTYNFDETPPTVSIANATIKETEAGQTLNLQLTRTGTSTLPASVTVNTSDGTATTADGDYTALTNQVVTIPASGSDPDTSVFVSVPIGGDGTVEPNETFTVTISNAVNAALGTTTATATIENNDVELSFALAAPNVGESAGTATITVNRNGATANSAGVSYATSAGTANPGPGGPFNPIDYVAASGPLSIPGAGTSTTFDITINPDLISEVNETVLLTLSTIVAGPGDNVTIVGTNPSTLTILDDDGGGLVTVSGTITKYTGGGGIENVTVSLFDGVTTVTTTTDAAGNYSFSGVPSGASFSLTPACVPANPTCNGYIYDASAREYLNAYSNVTGADFIGYLGDNPRDITFVDTVQPSAGANIVVPITIMSQGTENSADFVLLYDDTKIDYVSETCGVGAPAGCAVSSAPFPGGRKFELSLDPGVTYTAGLRELIRVTFAEDTVLPADFNTPVTFAATPRNVANPSGISVPADYVNGLVIFAKGIEADIAGGLPANSGYGDGGHNNGDVIRIRNLVVGAVTVNPSINEFQRADSAPYLSRGDGKLNSGDTTVARRHVTGDLVGILNPAAGPTVAIPFVDGLPSEIYGDKTRRPNGNAMPPITMTVVDRNAIRGANVTVAIDLVSEGIETGFSYSVHFDTASLQMATGMTCPQVTLGPGWHAPATLDTNCTQAGMGRIGLNGFFNTFGTTFVPGTQRVILMTFFVPLSAPLGPTTLTFADMPVDDYVSDVNGDPVATTFDPGDVTIVATPTSSNAVVAGQVTNPSGIAVNRAQVSLTSSTGVVYRGTTNAFGNFTIEGVPAGATYIVTIGAKGYTFTPVSLNVTDSIGKIQLQLE